MLELDDELDQTTTLVWSTMVGLPLRRVNGPSTPGPGTNGHVTGLVNLEGAYEGALMVNCSMTLAARLASVMFATDTEADASDIRDAVGELANMVAGNIKAVLPHPSQIGLPVVAFGNDFSIRVLGGEVAGEVVYVSDEAPLAVTLVRRADRGV
jgi:CheY-specific phosphatase CheX